MATALGCDARIEQRREVLEEPADGAERGNATYVGSALPTRWRRPAAALDKVPACCSGSPAGAGESASARGHCPRIPGCSCCSCCTSGMLRMACRHQRLSDSEFGMSGRDGVIVCKPVTAALGRARARLAA